MSEVHVSFKRRILEWFGRRQGEGGPISEGRNSVTMMIRFWLLVASATAAEESLYRTHDCYNSSLLEYLPAMEKLLTPPAKVREWRPRDTLDATFRKLAMEEFALYDGPGQHKYEMAPYVFEYVEGPGIPRNLTVFEKCSVYDDKCEGGIYVQYLNGELYIAPAVKEEQCGDYRGVQEEHRILRRLHIVRLIEDVIALDQASNGVIGDFELWIQSDDAIKPKLQQYLSFGIAKEMHNKVYDNFKHQVSLAEAEADILSVQDWNRTIHEISASRRDYPWNSRLNKAVFRGTMRFEPWHYYCFPPGGNEAALYDERLMPLFESGELQCGRAGLMHVAKGCDYNDLFDIEITDAKTLDIYSNESYWMPLGQQERYKYSLLVEGHWGWSDRMKKLLAMGSAVIRQVNTGLDEWYTYLLEPWVHYIPVDHLFNALPAVVMWARAHDDDVLQISKNADEYAKFFLTTDAFRLHVHHLINRLSELQRLTYNITLLPGAASLKTNRTLATRRYIRRTC